MYRIVEFSHLLIKNYLNTLSKNQLIVVDATLGNGQDTAFIANLIKDKGHVYSYDIQELSIENTSKLLIKDNINNVTLKCKSHEFIDESNIDLVIFNLGYLPGNKNGITTKADTTLKALTNLLPKMNKQNMLIIICVYIGHEEGIKESILLDSYVKNLSSHDFLVCKYQNYNRPSSPYIITISYN